MPSTPSPSPSPRYDFAALKKRALGLPGVRKLHERRLLLPAMLVLLVLLVLAEGVFRRNATDLTPPTAALSPPTTLPLLRPDLEKTPLTYFSDYWRQLAARTMSSLVLVGETQVPAVVLESGLAMTTADVKEGSADGGGALEIVGLDVDLGLALVRLSGADELAPFEDADMDKTEAGAFVAAVTLDSEKRPRILPGYLLSRSTTQLPGTDLDLLDIALPPVPLAGPAAVVNLDRRMVGLAVSGRDGVRVFSASAVRRLAERLASGAATRTIEVEPLQHDVKKALSLKSGVVVARVCERSFHERSELRPGDVILAHEGKGIRDAKEFNDWLDGRRVGESASLAIWRDGSRMIVSLVIPEKNCRPALAPIINLAALGCTVQRETGSNGLRIIAILSGAAAETAGLRTGDVIQAVDGQTLPPGSVRSRLARMSRMGLPVVMTVARNDRVRLVVVTPTE